MHEREVIERMTERGLRLATAESTVGGLIGHLLTNVPGSSKVFVGGIIAYHGGPKMALLGVDRHTLRAEGPIPEHGVRARAHGARRALAVRARVPGTGPAGRTQPARNRARPESLIADRTAWRDASSNRP